MKSNSISLEDELQALDKKCKLLLTGEWISLVLSGVGTVVTAITNQAIFAATPLTCSLFLNILSRSHQDKRIYDQSSQNLIEIQRQYASKIQGLRSEFLGLDFSDENGEGLPRSESFEELASKVKQLESFLEIQGGDYYSQGGAINQEVSILRNHQLEMAEAIETLTQQFETGAPEQTNHHDIQDHLDRLSAAVYELEQKTAELSNRDESTHEIQGLMSSESDITHLLDPVQSQMGALEERMNMIATADPAYDPETLQRDMQAMINPLHEQLSVLEEKVTAQSLTQATIEADHAVDSTQLNSINESMDELRTKLDASIAQISADIGNFQASLQNTHDQMDQLHLQMTSMQEVTRESSQASTPEEIQKQVESINTPLKKRLDGIQEQLGEISLLHAQIDQVRILAQQSTESFSPNVIHAQVNEATAPLMAKISSVEEKIKDQSSAQDFTGQLHRVIEPLQSHLVSLEQRINQLSSEGDRTPLLNKIAALQGQVQQVETRLASVPTQAVDHSHDIRQLTEKISDMQAHLDTVSQKVSKDLENMPNVIETKVEEKADLLSELQALSFEEAITESKKETRSELDTLLDSLNF